MNKIKRGLRLAGFTIGFVFISHWAEAQGNPPPQGGGGEGGSTSGPIDGGTIGLLIGMAIYGHRQIKNGGQSIGL